MNLPVYNVTIFSIFFTDQNLPPIVNILSYGHVTKIARDDRLCSEPTTEVIVLSVIPHTRPVLHCICTLLPASIFIFQINL